MFDEVIEIPEENIFMDFELDGQKFIVFSNSPELNEGDDVFFAKQDIVDGVRLIRNIEDDEEFAKVEAEYERRLEILGEDEEDAE